ncbi:MAG: type II secretion system F family protein [Gammaproteobacteria bacterium]|nr:type II secretion system F family protein [Gammaproteobacteria bacterium]
MPSFEYEGRTIEGKKVHGTRLSQSTDILASQLIREGITPINITFKSEMKLNLPFFLKFFEKKSISTEDMAMFSRQMHTLLKSGVPLTLALRQLSENVRHPYMSFVLNRLIEGLESGHELVAVIKTFPDFFSPVMVGMLQVGQNTGHLDDAFLRLNQYLELESSALKRVKATMRYPAFVTLAIIAAFVIVTIWVIPTFARVFQQSNIPLPAMTRVLIGLSDFFSRHWFLILLFMSSAIGSLIYWLHTPQGRFQWDKYQLQIPVIGEILRRVVLLRFTQAFSMVVSAGIPLLEGIGLVAQTTDNAYATQEILAMRDSILHGLTLTRAVATTKLFTPLEVQMLKVSEETGELASMLDQIATYYRREVEYDLKKLNDIMEPVMIVSLAVIILILAFAVYLPIWNMVKLVHSG